MAPGGPSADRRKSSVAAEIAFSYHNNQKRDSHFSGHSFDNEMYLKGHNGHPPPSAGRRTTVLKASDEPSMQYAKNNSAANSTVSLFASHPHHNSHSPHSLAPVSGLGDNESMEEHFTVSPFFLFCPSSDYSLCTLSNLNIEIVAMFEAVFSSLPAPLLSLLLITLTTLELVIHSVNHLLNPSRLTAFFCVSICPFRSIDDLCLCRDCER